VYVYTYIQLYQAKQQAIDEAAEVQK
jgi:hypothetical protein